MTRFLRTGCLFSLPVLAALALGESRLANVPNVFSARLQLVDEHRGSIEAIVLGSSHEYEAVNTDLFIRSAVNLAMPSQSLTQSSEVALKYLPVFRRTGQSTGATLVLPKLRYVLLGISYFSLPYRMATTGDERLGFYMRTYHVFADTTTADLVNPLRHTYIGIYGWGKVQSVLRDPAANSSVRMSPTGYSPDLPSLRHLSGPESFAASAAARAGFHHAIARADAVPANLEWMRRLARQCQLAGVKLVLFTTPVTKAYADAFGEETWRQYRSQIEEFSSEVGAGYTDYSRRPEFDWQDFGDADHLNEVGAAKFTRILADGLF